MNIKLINRGTTGEIMMQGRLDANTAPEVETIFNDVASRFDTVILNLTDLDYTSSAGLRIILKLHTAMARKGGELKLTGVNPMVMEVFEMTGFASLLTIE